MASNAEKCIINPEENQGDPSMKRKESLTTALQGKEKVVRTGDGSNGPSLDMQTWKNHVVLPRLPKDATLRWNYRQDHADDIPTLENQWWEGLKGEIRRLVKKTLPKIISWEYVDDRGKESLDTWFPLAKDYIDFCKKRDHQYGSLCIYSAWIWHILLDCIFSPSSKRWFGDDWKSFGRFHSKFREQVDSIDNDFTLSFYAWRSESVRMLYAFNGDHVDPKLVKQTLRDHLEPSFAAKGADDKIIEKTLLSIAKQAILIDRQMLASRWDCRIEMCCPSSGQKSGFLFTTDKTLMESDGHFPETESPCEGARVDFVSVPSLRVLGKSGAVEDSNPYVDFMSRRLVKYYHLSRLHIPMLVVTDQLSDNQFERWEAEEAGKERAEKEKGVCEGAAAEDI
ncbi:unnamed protein product [Clonostachys rhizophaga]|uniref:Uncharacterized protein n=1 Tax=Clonostachys rhizophaga TaxID=160324 RepID=A0A9N9VFJ2_9HYPO|nr:unnamed protein product [Clonostachys rhizophaga]